MNIRFRSGFITALGRVPGIRKFLPDHRQGTRNTSTAGIALTGNLPQLIIYSIIIYNCFQLWYK